MEIPEGQETDLPMSFFSWMNLTLARDSAASSSDGGGGEGGGGGEERRGEEDGVKRE